VIGELSPPRRPRTIRRTSTVDIACDDAGERLVLHGSARDLATDADSRIRVLATARARTSVHLASGTVSEIQVEPDQRDRTMPLVGLPAGSGFRRALRRELPDLTSDGSLLGLLLDEVPVAVVIGRSLVRRQSRGMARSGRPGPPVDVCAGWAQEGLLAVTVAKTGSPPMSEGPRVMPLASDGDPDAWHRLDPLPAWSMRRARRIDVLFPAAGGDAYEVDSIFRDSRLTGDGVERSVHEYAVRATVDRGGTILAVEAIPGVLPAPECPAAAASAQRLVGLRLGDLRTHVATSFTGTSTCTHLNDALRALGDLGMLIGAGFSEEERVRHG
jgi:hypothetical protein